jgi:DNA-binding transcriptional ArsR family regulator
MDDQQLQDVPPTGGNDTVVVRDLETLRVLSDPLRMRMVELMGRGEWTAKQLSASLGVGQTRLYHHIALLEAHGLIRLAGTRLVAGIVEKRYVAPSLLTVDSNLFAGGAETPAAVGRTVDGLVATALATVRREIARAVEAGTIAVDASGASPDAADKHGLQLVLDEGKLSEDQAAQFRSRVEALVREFAELSRQTSPGSNGRPDEAVGPEVANYRLLVAFFKASGPA